MMNYLWPFFIIISFMFAFLTGNIENVNNSIFQSTEDAIKLTLTLLETICLWNGIMQIASKTSILKRLTKLLKPFINFLFPELKENISIKSEISMNMIANILGLGNAATPIGLRVMKQLQKENPKKDTLSNSMAMFIVLNTASLQIIPTTVIAIRSNMDSINPTKIIIPVWIVTICAAITAIISTKIFIKRGK